MMPNIGVSGSNSSSANSAAGGGQTFANNYTTNSLPWGVIAMVAGLVVVGILIWKFIK